MAAHLPVLSLAFQDTNRDALIPYDVRAMPTAFTRTARALRADAFAGTLVGILLTGVLLAAWGVWAVRARVTRYETSDVARVEAGRAAYILQASSAGRVVSSHLTLGRDVQAGEVLVELDANPEQLQIDEQQTRRVALEPQLRSLREEFAMAVRARAREQEAAAPALEEARSRIAEAEQPANFGASEANRVKELLNQGLTTEREFARAESEARRAKAAVESLRQVLLRLELEQRTRVTDRDAQINRLEAEIHRLEGDSSTAAAAITRLEYDAEARRIRAPISGRLGEVSTLRIGAVLREGEKIGSIVPPGLLRIVAEFPPAGALGRIRPGQSGRLRLKGFPWAQYGTIPALVAAVANEVRDGTVRVELDLAADVPPTIPLQHGLTGSIEIGVEEVSPLVLALRAAGGIVAAPRRALGAD